MKKYGYCIIICCLIAAASVLPGCRSGVTTDGRSCYELSGREKRRLVDFSRTALLQDRKGLLRRGEANIIKRAEPELKIEYTGDKLGEASVSWEAPGRRIGIIFNGELVELNRSRISLYSSEKSSAVVDYSGQLSRRAKQEVEKIKTDNAGPARILRSSR